MTSQALGSIPSCDSCGERRIFELQLMPALVSVLNIDTNRKTASKLDNSADCGEPEIRREGLECLGSESIEFGTVLVYTCSQSCWSEDASFLEEFVIVQSDPDQHLFVNKNKT